MARGTKKLDGQLDLWDFSTDISNYVVQSNTLIGGKQSLKLNSAKIVRAAIMQVVWEDKELKPYKVTIKELAKLLDVPTSNIYRDIESIVSDIIGNPVQIKKETGRKVCWTKIPWVKRCDYNSDVGLVLMLNEELKPYLLNLKEHYTQYTLENILTMNSIYAIRVFELLQSKIMTKTLPKDGKHIIISVQELRECCDCEDKLLEFSNFRIRVIEYAVKEINKSSTFRIVDYTYIKTGRKVTAIDFYVNISYHLW